MEDNTMTYNQFVGLLNKWGFDEAELARRKGEDYAGADFDNDPFANFKRMHEICKMYDINPAKRPEDTFLFLAFLKMDRIAINVHREKKPNNESVVDSIRDNVLYIHLLAGFLTDLDWKKQEEEREVDPNLRHSRRSNAKS